MTSEKFLEGITLLQTAISITKGTDIELTEKQLKLYKLLLDDIPEHDFVIGITKLLKNRVYTNFPSPAEIREYCFGLKEFEIEARILEAKEKLKKALSTIGTYKSVAFDDPIIHIIIRELGGWTKLGTMNIDEFNNYLKWDFPKSYKIYATNSFGEIPTFFLGIEKNENNIIYIGDENKAKNWILKYKNSINNKTIENKRKILLEE